MKEPVWEMQVWKRWMMRPLLRYEWMLEAGCSGEIGSERTYTRIWSAERGGRRYHARYLKGTIRERSK